MERPVAHRAAAATSDMVKAVKGVKPGQSELNSFDSCEGSRRIGGKKERRFAEQFLRGFGVSRIAADNNYARAICDESARRRKTKARCSPNDNQRFAVECATVHFVRKTVL
jgi:hypothetical protein